MAPTKRETVFRIGALALIAAAGAQADIDFDALNERIRRDKFDEVLPVIMAKHGVDMWLHVMRNARWANPGDRDWLPPKS